MRHCSDLVFTSVLRDLITSSQLLVCLFTPGIKTPPECVSCYLLLSDLTSLPYMQIDMHVISVLKERERERESLKESMSCVQFCSVVSEIRDLDRVLILCPQTNQ